MFMLSLAVYKSDTLIKPVLLNRIGNLKKNPLLQKCGDSGLVIYY